MEMKRQKNIELNINGSISTQFMSLFDVLLIIKKLVYMADNKLKKK
jgi:hypothetical protein